MRKAFHEELERVAQTLVEMTRMASSAMTRATTALLDADIHLADSVIAADAEIDARRALSITRCGPADAPPQTGPARVVCDALWSPRN